MFSATNLFHDLRPLLVIELQLCNGFIDAHPFDLWRRTNSEMKQACSLPEAVDHASLTDHSEFMSKTQQIKI